MDAITSGIQNSCPGALHGTPATLFLTLINSLFAAQCSLVTPPTPTCNLKDGDEFDFIVVGSGPTGSVVANRLSKNPNWKVLLLEAGGTPSVVTKIPALWNELLGSPESWNYTAESQEEACQGFQEKACHITTGRVLGGTSSINGMIYIRGKPIDYDTWEQNGNTGWNWSSVLPLFKKSEDNLEFGNDTRYHGTGGELKIGPMYYNSSIKDKLTCAAKELGYKIHRDLNGGKWLGYGSTQGFVYQGKRYSAYSAFIQPIEGRSNLCIATHAFVTKILIDPFNKTAYGIEVIKNDQHMKIFARKEVIISAGAIRTPMLLLNTGIGPKSHLERMEIPIVQQLDVGRNFQDHVSLIYPFVALRPNGTKCESILNMQTDYTLDNIFRYFMYNEGPFGTIGLSNFNGFLNTTKNNSKSVYPNIQIQHQYLDKGSLQANPFILKNFNIDETILKNIIELNNKDALLIFIPTLLNPKSRGYIELKSTDPLESPRLVTNYLTDEEDVNAMIEVIKYISKFLKTKCLSECKPEILDLKIPACSNYKFKSITYYKCAIRYMSFSTYHYCGTAKMGPDSDPTAVVNPQLQVRGIEHLRVADASIMPKIIRGNPTATCYMIGEKASLMIKNKWSP